MTNTAKMFKTMVKGLSAYPNFKDKAVFWDWYWEQIPDERNGNESLFETWETFKDSITLGGLRFNLRMWYNIHFGKHYKGYSHTFKRNGYFVKDWRTSGWWFIPNDKTFRYGAVSACDEYKNGNVFIG